MEFKPALCHIGGMDKKPLTKEQFESLAELKKGMAGNKIPNDHAKLLTEYGYAKESLGGFPMITDDGRKRMKVGR